ncbi:MAG: VWA domain-containing protein [Acidobacteria bacterium]|nr:MAG: VWA domain-containing protein [Acidobacteriota bacterium]
MARRSVSVFSLSFLDAMTCGLGAVVLLYMVINASVVGRTGDLTATLRAETERLESEVLDGQRNLVELQNAVREIEDERVAAHGLSSRMLETVAEVEKELATFEADTLARRQHVNQLMTDLRTLEDSARRLSASTPSLETPGDRVRTHVGDGDRQYLTGLKVGGRRILLLVDSSASMLDETIVNVIRRRNQTEERRRQAEKWQQAVATVDWLTTQLPRDSDFQIYTFADHAKPVVEGSGGRWLDAGDRATLESVVTGINEVVPAGGTNLYRAVSVIAELDPAPDNVILLVDGLPTQGKSAKRSGTVSGKQRVKLFNNAVKQVPNKIPVNTILFPMEGDPLASSAYWKLAIATDGSFVSPTRGWP